MDSLIFDIDGTIWDARSSAAEAWTKAIQKHSDLGIILTADDLTPLFGKSTTEISDAIFGIGKIDEKKKEFLMDKCFENENKHLKEKPGKVYDGVEEMLEKLSRKYPMFIVSNCNLGYIETMLEATGFGKYFKDHVCFAETMRPKGENIRMIADKYGLEAPVYIGDTQGDLEACRMAGVPMVYVTYGLGKAEDPEYTADSPEEVCKILLDQAAAGE